MLLVFISLYTVSVVVESYKQLVVGDVVKMEDMLLEGIDDG